MAKTAMIRARVEPELKQEAEKVFTTLGLSPTEAITLFYKQTALHNGLPFALRIPNEETLAAIRQVESGKGLSTYGRRRGDARRLVEGCVNCASRRSFVGTILGVSRRSGLAADLG